MKEKKMEGEEEEGERGERGERGEEREAGGRGKRDIYLSRLGIRSSEREGLVEHVEEHCPVGFKVCCNLQ
jgi:hypothetical protein